MCAANTRSALAVCRTAPSGCRHAPRPSITGSRRRSRSHAAGPRRGSPSSDVGGDRRQPEHARAALTCRFGREVADDLGDGGQRPIGTVYVDQTGSEVGAGRGQRGRRQGEIGGSRPLDPAPSVPAEQDGSRRRGHAPGPMHQLRDVHVQAGFDHARPANGAAHRDQPRRRGGDTGVEPELGAAGGGLRVQDQDGYPSSSGTFGGERGAADHRAGLSSGREGGQRRAFTGDVAGRRAEHPYAGESTLLGQENRPQPGHGRGSGVNGEQHVPGLNSVGDQGRTVEDQSRHPGDQLGVLGDQRLTVARVDDQARCTADR